MKVYPSALRPPPSALRPPPSANRQPPTANRQHSWERFPPPPRNAEDKPQKQLLQREAHAPRHRCRQRPAVDGEARLNDFGHVYVPPPEGDPQTLLLLHGEASDENRFLPFGKEVAPSAGLLALRGGISQADSVRFLRRLPEDLHREELRRRSDELADVVLKAAEEYGFAPSAVVALGHGNGATIAAGILLYRPETLFAAALLHAPTPALPPKSPSLRDKRILLVAGEQDPLIAVEETTRLHTTLHRFGAEVETVWFPGNDELTPAKAQAVAQWLKTLQAKG